MTNIQDHLAGQQLPTGDIPCEADIPALRSHHIAGACGGRNVKAAYGSQLVPTRQPQDYVLRIGEGGNPAHGCHLHDFSVWNHPTGDGLVIRCWSGLLMRQVGFVNCKRGLVLDAIEKSSDGDFRFQASKCGTGCYVNLAYANRICNTITAALDSNDVGIEFGPDIGPKEFYTERLHVEASKVAGVIQRSGTVVYSRMYNEHRYGTTSTRVGDLRYLVPGVAVLGGTAVFDRLQYCNYLYVAPGADFVTERSIDEIKYIVLVETDPRVPLFAAKYPPRPGERVRILTVAEPWEKGKRLPWKNVPPQ